MFRSSLTTAIALAVALSSALPAVAQSADCTTIEKQLDRDKEAMKRQQDSILKNNDELAEWDKANKEALLSAAKDAAKLVASRIINTLEGKEKALRGLQDGIQKNVFRKIGAKDAEYLANVQAQLRDSVAAYDKAKRLIDLREILEVATSAESMWSMMNNTIKAVADAQAKTDAVVKAAIKDPSISSWFESDHAMSEFAQSFTEMALESAGFGPYVDIASFVVNGSYDALKWTKSRERILQSADLSEQQLKAVDSLKKQIERTVEHLQICRQDAAKAKAEQTKPEPPKSVKSGPSTAKIVGGVAAAGAVGVATYVALGQIADLSFGGGSTTGSGSSSSSGGSTASGNRFDGSYRASVTRSCTPGGNRASEPCNQAIVGPSCSPVSFTFTVTNGAIRDCGPWFTGASASVSSFSSVSTSGTFSGNYQGVGSSPGVPLVGSLASLPATLSGSAVLRGNTYRITISVSK